MIDKRFIGHRMPPFTVDVEKGRLRFFAKATGQDEDAYAENRRSDIMYPGTE